MLLYCLLHNGIHRDGSLRSSHHPPLHAAVSIQTAGLAERCTVQLAYAIGIADPVALGVDTHGTGKIAEDALERAIPRVFPLTPAGMIAALDLLRPIYRATAVYGHFGREGFSWERTDRVAALRQALAR